MFDLSLVELAVIALVALLVLGPERLPRAARTAGLYLRKARQSWYSVKSDIERELAADELRRSLRDSADKARSEISEVDRKLRDTAAMARIGAPAGVKDASAAASTESSDAATDAASTSAGPAAADDAGDSQPTAAPDDGSAAEVDVDAQDAATRPRATGSDLR